LFQRKWIWKQAHFLFIVRRYISYFYIKFIDFVLYIIMKLSDLSFNCFRLQLKTFLFCKYWHQSQHYFSALETLLMRSTNAWYLLTYLLMVYRVFVSGQITTNTTSANSLPQRSINRPSLQSSSSSSSRGPVAATEHPAPLFLRHVVNRRFKYRWLVLALTGFTCMSIIVILSVVYSNWSIKQEATLSQRWPRDAPRSRFLRNRRPILRLHTIFRTLI